MPPPGLDGERCHWLAADFDGSTAVLDALAYLKAARAVGASAALEVSRSGLGAHVWLFFTGLVPAATARQLGSGLLREAIAVRGRMDLTSYDIGIDENPRADNPAHHDHRCVKQSEPAREFWQGIWIGWLRPNLD